MSLTVKIQVSLIGKNQLTIPIAQNLTSQLYDVTLYYRKDLSDCLSLDDYYDRNC